MFSLHTGEGSIGTYFWNAWGTLQNHEQRLRYKQKKINRYQAKHITFLDKHSTYDIWWCRQLKRIRTDH